VRVRPARTRPARYITRSVVTGRCGVVIVFAVGVAAISGSLISIVALLARFFEPIAADGYAIRVKRRVGGFGTAPIRHGLRTGNLGVDAASFAFAARHLVSRTWQVVIAV
jgi:hypothetical protein